MLSVFIIDDMVYRFGLISILKEFPEFEVVGEGENVESSLEKIHQLRPDVIIIDIYLNSTGGTEMIEDIRSGSVESKILVLTRSPREEDCLKCIKAGARGYLQKGLKIDELIECIKLVANGDAMVFTSNAAKALETSWLPNNGVKNGPNNLSEREKEILDFVSQGINTKEISEKCFVSETTVKAHLKRVMEKLGAKNRAQAVAKAIEKGLIHQA